ncbi:MAG: tRNA pseudouridine(13) synthase TruD [Candidatus Micrarchaeia archaeon]
MKYLSKSPGTKGTIKQSAEDFVVKEIIDTGIVLEPNRKYAPDELGKRENAESKFAVLVLQKKNWNTIQALIAIAKKLGRGKKSISYAGTKDRRAMTVQLASIYGANPEALMRVHIKDISINGAWLGDKIELGSNIGNRFEIRIADCANPENAGKVLEELAGVMPNYFGEQRFGIRGNNASIGMHLLRNELKEAAMEFLTSTDGETDEEAVSARKELAESMDFAKALDAFPRYLAPERAMLAHLSKHQNDFAGALRVVPRGVLIMFVHAVQAKIFNEELDMRVANGDFDSALRCAENFYGFPDTDRIASEGKFPAASIVGYDSEASKLNDYEQKILDAMQIKAQDFNIRSMPELSMRGSFRPILVNFKNMAYGIDNNDVKLSFELPTGAYATVLLNEVIK